MKDPKQRQLREARRELDVFSSKAVTFDTSVVPRLTHPRGIDYFSSHLEEDPWASLWLHDAVVVGSGDMFATGGYGISLVDSGYNWKRIIPAIDGTEVPNKIFMPGNIALVNEHVIAFANSPMDIDTDTNGNSNSLNCLYTFDLETSQIIATKIIGRSGVAISRVDALLHNDVLIVGDYGGSLYVVVHSNGADLQIQGEIHSVHRDRIYKIAVAEAAFAASSLDETVSVWDMVSRKCIGCIPTTHDVADIDLDERYLVCAVAGALRVYERRQLCNNNNNNNKTPKSASYYYRLLLCLNGAVANVNVYNGAMKLLPKNLVIAAAEDGCIIVIDLVANSELARYKVRFSDIVALDITCDGRLIASSGDPIYGTHAVFTVRSPKQVVDALQIYARNRFGRSSPKKLKETKVRTRRKRRITVISIAAGSGLSAVLLWSACRLILI